MGCPREKRCRGPPTHTPYPRPLTGEAAGRRRGPAWRRGSAGATRRAVTTATLAKTRRGDWLPRDGAADRSGRVLPHRVRPPERGTPPRLTAGPRPPRPRAPLRARPGWAAQRPPHLALLLLFLRRPGASAPCPARGLLPCRQGRGRPPLPPFVTEAQRSSAARGDGSSLRPAVKLGPGGGDRGRCGLFDGEGLEIWGCFGFLFLVGFFFSPRLLESAAKVACVGAFLSASPHGDRF